MAQDSESGMHRRLTLNSISNLARFLVFTGIALFLTPFIVRTLGDSLYGFWVTLAAFIGYASLLEFGVQPAVVKLVGEYRAVDDKSKLDELISTALMFFLGVGSLAAVGCAVIIPLWIARFVEDLAGLANSRLIFVLIGVEALVSYMNYLVTGILYGHQRYHLKNLIDSGGFALNAILILTFLPSGGLLALIGAKLFCDSLVTVSGLLAVRRLMPELRISPRVIRRSSFRELISFGGRVFVSATTTRLATHAQPLIISTAISASATAFFAVPVKLLDYARQVGYTLTTAFMPMFSELQSRKETELLRKFYVDYTRYLFTLLSPIAILLMIYGAAFIGIWIGAEYQERGRIVMLILATNLLLEMFQPLLWRFFIGVGELNYLVKVSAIISILSIVLGIAFVKPFGIVGVALGQLFCGVLVHGANAVVSCRYLKISVLEFFLRAHARSAVAGLVLAVVAVVMSKFVGTTSYLKIFGGCFAAVVVYAPLAISLGLTASERSTLRIKIAERLPG